MPQRLFQPTTPPRLLPYISGSTPGPGFNPNPNPPFPTTLQPLFPSSSHPPTSISIRQPPAAASLIVADPARLHDAACLSCLTLSLSSLISPLHSSISSGEACEFIFLTQPLLAVVSNGCLSVSVSCLILTRRPLVLRHRAPVTQVHCLNPRSALLSHSLNLSVSVLMISSLFVISFFLLCFCRFVPDAASSSSGVVDMARPPKRPSRGGAGGLVGPGRAQPSKSSAGAGAGLATRGADLHPPSA